MKNNTRFYLHKAHKVISVLEVKIMVIFRERSILIRKKKEGRILKYC